MTAQELTDLRSMSDKEIRRAQDIVRMQLPLAYEQRNTEALIKLQEWELTYIDELCRRDAETLAPWRKEVAKA